MSNPTRILTTLAALALLLVAAASPAAAHASQTTADGKYRVTWGWMDEPQFTNSKLRLELIIRDNATGAGVGDLSGADITELSLVRGDDVYSWGNITPFRGAKSGVFAGPGNYTGAKAVYVTQPGLYALRIKGTIDGTPVDLTIPAAHELEGPEDIAFPAPPASDEDLAAKVSDLEARVAALEAKAQTQSQTPATVSPQPTGERASPIPAAGLVLAALAAVGAALVLRRR